jgi:hypothetical protein
MIARCIRNTGKSLGQPVRKAFHTSETIFHVTVGTEYDVLGLGVFETTLLALVLDDTAAPNWLPVGLFAFQNTTMPAGWQFSVLNELAASGAPASDQWVALWGYPELVRSPSHSNELVEREPAALEIFFTELANERASRS